MSSTVGDARRAITVVIPALNEADTVAGCIRSVFACELSDSVEKIVVVDGCSSDQTAAVARSEGAIVVPNPDRHVAAARQIGLENASTPIVAYIDADCVASADWVSTILDRFSAGTLGGLGGPYVAAANEDVFAQFAATTFESVMDFPGEHHLVQSKSVRGCIVGGNCAFSVDALRAIGGFDVTLRNHGEDIDVAWRLIDAGSTVVFEPALRVEHRYNPGLASVMSTWFRYGIASSMLAKRHLKTPAIDLRLHRAMLLSLLGVFRSPRNSALRAAQLGSHLAGKIAGSFMEGVVNL